MADLSERLSAVIGDRYEFVRELGRGGMATVYLAKDLKHDRDVAVKVLLPDLSASIGGERFEREIRVAGRLQHPHILGMYDSGVADGLLYYVMPFVEGESLRDRIDREGQLPVDDAFAIMLEVTDALSYAHKQHIIHRDIKPENILISGGHALVADFGIARAVEDSGQQLTQTGMALGTPAYMAPEQSMGEKVGPTADIYALGCMLFEMLAGEPPFSGKNAAAIMAKHVMEQVPSVRIVRPSVPEEVELAIFSAMGKSPVDRPQSCDAFAELLVAVPSGHTSTRLMTMRHTTARRTGMVTSSFPTGESAPAPVWRRLTVLVLAAAVLLAAVGFGAWRMSRNAPAPLAAIDGLDPRHIAVLYFDNRGSGDSLAVLADGLTETLIQSLGQVPTLQVVSRGGVEAWRGNTTVGADSIARALDAGTIVRGSVEPIGDRVRVTVRLIDGNSGSDVGDPHDFESSSSDFTSIRDSTALEVAALIRERLGQEVRLRQQRQGTSNNEAWLLLQRAERARRNAGTVALDEAEPMLARADTMLANAERLDPTWVNPIIARAAVAYDLSRRVGGGDPLLASAPIERGIGHVNRALALAPQDPDALELRGNLQYWRWLIGLEQDPVKAAALIASARADYELATRVNPNQAGAWASLSHLYYNVDDATLTQVNVAATRAWEADAFLANAETVLTRLFLSAYDLEDWAGGQRWCKQMQRRFPRSHQAPRCQLFLLTANTTAIAPDIDLAWTLADSVTALADPGEREYQRFNSAMLVSAVIARAAKATPAAGGLADSARHVLERSRGNPGIDPSADLAQFAAFTHVLLGDTTAAISDLTTFLSKSDRRRTSLATNPGWWYRPIQGIPAFQRLVGTPP